MPERERSKKRRQIDRYGGGPGGKIRTAVDTDPSGSPQPDSLVLKPTTALLGSNVLQRFALSILIDPFVEVLFDGSDSVSVTEALNLYRPRLLVVDVEDNSALALEVLELINSEEARGTRFIVVASLQVACQFYRRLSNAGVAALCLIQSGPEIVRDALHAVISGNKYFDPLLADLISQRLYALSPSGNLTLDESDILMRLRFSDALLCSELELRTDSLSDVLAALFAKLAVSSRAEAIAKAVQAGFSLLDDKGFSDRKTDARIEEKSCTIKCERVVARWLEEQLMASPS